MDESTPGDERELEALLREHALGLVRAARAALDAAEAVLSTPGGMAAMSNLIRKLATLVTEPERSGSAASAPSNAPAPSDPSHDDDLHHIEVR